MIERNGQIAAGNIDLNRRPVVRNADGTISTVRSMSIGTDQGEVLIPTVSDDGRIMADDEAISTYYKTGKNLGIFSSVEAATSYAEVLHNQQAARYAPQEASLYQPLADRAKVDREASYYGASKGLALAEMFHDAQITDRLLGYIGADDGRAFEAKRNRVFGVDAPLSASEANARFGVAGRLSFDKPVSEAMAGWRQGLAQREAFQEEVVANANVGPLEALGASLAGSIFDPVGAPLWLIPEMATGRALRSGVAATRLGRLGAIERGVITGATEGVAGSVLFEGANLWLHHEASDDYDLGQASANIVFGGLLGAALGGGGGWWEGRGARGKAPAVVEGLSDNGRIGAFSEALEAVIEDRPVNLGPMLVREAEARQAGRVPREIADRLDETRARASEVEFGGGPESGTLAARYLNDDVAVTPRGAEVRVRYALVEARDLITSHDDDLFATPDYPRELQPRQRDRAGAQARNRALEAELNPKRLMNDVGAETGAPIVSADGVVESGNGRTIAVRRSYRSGSEASGRYRRELEGRGFDVSGMDEPVLVRVRSDPLDASERIKLTRDMNAEATEAYSPSERAAADAQTVDDDLLGLIEGSDLNGAGNRRFVRAFLDRVASDDLNRMTTADGRLSDAGLDRISAAMVYRAYGDRGLVEALFEATDSNIKAIGRALADAAPEWAAMRAAVARGEAPAALDPTASLTAAVNFVRHVRQRGQNLAETMDLTIGQYDAFSGSAMTPETEAFVRSFFRTSGEGVTLWKSPRSAAGLSDGLKWLAGEIRKAEPGPNLFGDIADAGTTRNLLDGLGQWFARKGDDGGPPPGLDFGRDPTVSAGGNVRPVGDAAGRVVGRPETGDPAKRVKPKVPKGETPPPPKGDPFADPEVAALLADTDAALLRAGLDPSDIAAATPAGQDPQTVADAVSAAAFCLKGGA